MLCNFIWRTVSTWQLRSSRVAFVKSRQESGFIPLWGKKVLTVQCAFRRWEEDFSLINMRWILQPEKVSASVFLHGRQFDLQTGRQSAPAGQAALVVVRYQMHQTQQSCPLQCVQHIAASSIIKSPPLLIAAILNSSRHHHFLRLRRSETKPTWRRGAPYYTASIPNPWFFGTVRRLFHSCLIVFWSLIILTSSFFHCNFIWSVT